MKQLPSDKYTVAWFKLAEFVTRGEKERAMGLYRLLMHSFDDRAFAYQLEGDLLHSFNDSAAKYRYESAALAYQEDGRIIEAAAVYENLIFLNPEHEQYLLSLIELYEQLGMQSRVTNCRVTLYETLLKKGDVQGAIALLNLLEPYAGLAQRAQLCKQLIVVLIQSQVRHEEVLPYIKDALDNLQKAQDDTQLQSFFSLLRALDDRCYQFACDYLNDLISLR